jgi:prolyl-tRNA editing enzyme YbaK/EbsC (Cys-tRNA(Pro) deacylase)
VGSWFAKIDTDPAAGGGLRLDERFFPHGEVWRGRGVHQVRLGGGDASSDSYCYPLSVLILVRRGGDAPVSLLRMPVDFARFAAVLRDLGVAGEVRELPESAPTAATAAGQLGCELGAIANSLVFNADGAPLLVMTSGAHRVDTAQVAGLTGVAEVRRADARSVREWTGQAIGGVAPVGHPRPIRTLVDVWLDKYDVIWAAAGHPHTVFPTSYAELLRITNGTPADVGE